MDVWELRTTGTDNWETDNWDRQAWPTGVERDITRKNARGNGRKGQASTRGVWIKLALNETHSFSAYMRQRCIESCFARRTPDTAPIKPVPDRIGCESGLSSSWNWHRIHIDFSGVG